MKSPFLLRLYFCLLLLSFPLTAECADRNEGEIKDLPVILGATVEQTTFRLNLSLNNCEVIEEPPSIPRGLICRDKDRHKEIWLYISRGDVSQKLEGQWAISEFLDKKIIGVAVKEKERWESIGRVIPYFHFPHAMAKPKISWNNAKKIANAFIEENKIFGSDTFYLEPNQYGESWKKTVLEPILQSNPGQGPDLSTKSFHVFHYLVKTDKIIEDGDFWVFVDDVTGEILTVMKYLPDRKTW